MWNLLFRNNFSRLLLLLWATTPSLEAGDTRAFPVKPDADGGIVELQRVIDMAKGLEGSEPVEIVLEGKFRPRAAIALYWDRPAPLQIRGRPGTVIDGSALPADTDAVIGAGSSIRLDGLTIAGTPRHALRFGECRELEIQNCILRDTGGGGLVIWSAADPGAEVTPSRIVRNVVERFNLRGEKWTNDGISVAGDLFTIKDNVVRDCPAETMGIRLMGRLNRVEGNTIDDVGIADSGGIYLWGGKHILDFRGNQIVDNTVRRVARGIYLDDGTNGAEVSGNRIEKATVAAIYIGGGNGNTIRNNWMIDSAAAIHLDSRTLGWDGLPEKRDLWISARAEMESLISQPPQRLPYDWKILARDLKSGRLLMPADNICENNRRWGTPIEYQLENFAAEVKADFRAWNTLGEIPQQDPSLSSK